MGKKKLRSKYTSKGERRSIAKVGGDDRSVLQKEMDKFDAFTKGKEVWFTIENPNPNETNKRFIRVNGQIYFKTDNFKKLNERVVMV